MILHGYYRSAAAWRVRIALALKGLKVDHVAHHLVRGEQGDAAYLAINPQGLVPALELDDGSVVTQSLAILEYLEEIAPSPSLLPDGAGGRARCRAIALAIVADTHPVQNLRVLNRLRALGLDEDQVGEWVKTTIGGGLAAVETLLPERESLFAFGDDPTLADLCIVPQLANARRFGLALDRFPRVLAIEAAASAHPAFIAAAPDRQPDAE